MESKNIGYIYGLVCPVSNEIRYVGQTMNSTDYRFRRHLSNIYKSPSKKNSWLIGLDKKGMLDKVSIKIIETVDIEVLDEREVFWISHYRSKTDKLTNITPGGKSGCRGYKHTESAKAKIAESNRKRRGRKVSKRGRANISKAMMGQRGHNTGNKHSQETKDKISNKKKGIVSWNAKPVIQLTLEGIFIKEWRSGCDAAKNLGLSGGNIQSVIAGKRKTCGGYKWKLK